MIDAKTITNTLYSLGRTKSYAATIVLTLGVTLGALVAMFNLNYQLFAVPLPYPEADRLYTVKGNLYQEGKLTLEKNSQYPALIDIYKNGTNFSEKALVYFWEDVVRSLPDSPRVTVTYVTPEYLQLADAPLALGRHFSAEEGINRYVPVALLSYQNWKQQFNLDPNILERTIRFGEVDFRIIGVTAKDFIEPEVYSQGRQTQVWLPWDFNNTEESRRNNWRGLLPFLFVVGKLNEMTRPEAVEHELTASLNAKFQEALSGRSSGVELAMTYTLSPYEREILGDNASRTLLMFAGTLVLLLIAAANITNLILSRAVNRQRTMAIQVALGAQRQNIFADLLVEICLLMLAAALLSILLAVTGIELIKQLATAQIPRVQELTLNWQTCLFAVVASLLLSVFFASLVSRRFDYRLLQSMLQSSGKGAGIQISARTRQLLIISQIALTGILIAASLQVFLQSYRYLNQPLGFASRDILVTTLNIGTLRTTTAEQRQGDLRAIREKLLSHPKVLNASLNLNTPIGFSRPLWQTSLATDISRDFSVAAKTAVIDENYLPILEFPLLAGRHLSAAEFNDGSRVMLVNQTLARQLQRDGQVVGKQFYWRGPAPYRVIGVVQDASLPGRDEVPRLFVRHIDVDYPQIILKFKPGQPLTSSELNSLFAEVNGQYRVSEIFTLEQARDFLLANERLSAWLTCGLTLLALTLAAIGIYGVLSYSVRLRRFELGIRLAIGARPATIFVLVLRENLVPVATGLVATLLALAGLWLWTEQSNISLQVSLSGWLLPAVLILLLVTCTALLSVWRIISGPPIGALRDSQ